MGYSDFSKKELTDILDAIQASIMCKTEADIVNVITKVKDMLCADHAVCGMGEMDSNRLSRILKIVNLNYPGEWLSIYAKDELYKKDPIIRYNYEFFKAHLWSESIELYKDDCADFMNKASEFGLKYGVASGINASEPGNKGSIFSFSGDKKRFNRHHVKMLDILTPHIHQALARLCSSARGKCGNLSFREKEVLKWMKEGKTNWEISVILNISERTVKFHVQNIERKLNAVNKTHAIAIAMDTGLVV